ncbi:MAG: nitrogen regulation protein NR(I) [Gammaproteobacteria bacterium]|nr:nitrogen regulation protein NR(I) [Gammaproteobacteria bacterium]MDH3370450.1 nitrogen regulation protein NR(I) [Gammaproteobacteria bacterium]MDH3406430.1 nitrogen regulation protein NR(I) [Gammaproteobacteria bacterium]MDH3561892.1 nitrogen regulation protein NR(I) [Gammaproteobacteria bacterium]MDH5487055.1 nitrogen regulation protein NR(I) [Gammaproteobacteria bacterium]
MARPDIVWVIDDDRSIRWVLEKALTQADMTVKSFDSANDIAELLDRQRPDVVISDIRMPGMSGLDLLKTIHAKTPDIPVIIITAHTDLESAVASYRGGAFEYLPKPFDVDEAVRLTRRAIEHRRHQKVETPVNSETPEIIGSAASMQEVFRAIGRLSGSHLSVLINGESGTGKELVAHALHNHSPRAENFFIAINIAAIPSELLESELFGHEKGAFTGATHQRKGRFEQANQGTLFLDEIGDMPPALQTRLLRVLQDGKFYRVGGHDQVETNVRIIAATNQNLEDRVKDGIFREDLFHRLNVIRIHLPPLRERREDIPVLAAFFLKKSAAELNVETKQLAPPAEEYLSRLPWPGNVRQLENTCRWLTVMAPGPTVRVEDLPPELLAADTANAGTTDWEAQLKNTVEQQLARGEDEIFSRINDSFERILIEAALKHAGGRKQDAARKLGWGRNTLTRKLKDLDLI